MRDLATRLKEVLIDRYAIKREIGRGGMATVFLARDLRHDRDVALKVLHPAIASGVGSRRFEQEIKLAARLQHPHIVPVHDSGVAPDGPGEPDLLWFTMPFVEGESLRERLRREGQLPVADAVRITRQVSDALEYAHTHGVIHRDIKPENILLTGSHAMVSDFGVALAVSSEGGSSVDTLTAAGTAIGTIAYMSPEQSSAERNIDARTDQYSLACVLYEMLVGEPPFTGPTSQIVMTRRFTEVPRLLRATRPAVSESLERVVATALSRMPADRFATMSDFAAAIESPAAGKMRATPQQVRRRRATLLAGGVLVAVLASVITRFLPEPANAADMPPLIVVLPFDLQGDSADAYFADGMSDEVSGKLANLPGFRVVARASARQYRSSTKPLDQIAEELRVRYILTGKLTWLKANGDQHVVIRPELVEITRSGTLLSRWSEQFDVDSLTDVFAVQSEIASRIAAALQVAVTPSAAEALAAAPTRNIRAYDEFLRGEALYVRSSGPLDMLAARKHYETAVALDPEFARAWGRLSQVSSSYYNNNGDSASFETAQRAAARVLELDPKLPDAHLAMGNQFTLVRNNYRAAIAAYETGLALNPSHAELLSAIGLAQQALGNTEKAIDYMKRGLAVDPRSLVAARRLTRALTWAHRFEEAEVASRQALAISPYDASAVHYAALLELAQGDLAGARSISRTVPRDSLAKKLAYWATYYPMNGWWLDDEYKEVLALLPVAEYNDQDPASRFGVLSALAYRRGDRRLARTYADSAFEFVQDMPRPDSVPGPHIVYAGALAQVGRFDEAIKEGEIAVALRPNDYYVGANLRHNLIEIYILAGHYQRALDHLEAIVGMPYYMTPAWLRIDPTLAPLRNEPRFRKLIESR